MVETIKNIFSDITLLYKNFLHWNISKVLILIFSFLLGILLSLPFFIVLGLFLYFDPIEWKDIIYNYYTTQSFGLSLMTALSSHLLYIIVEGFIFIFAVGFFLFGYSYKTITLTNLNLSYIKGEKIGFFKNLYFDFGKIFKYLGIVGWVGLILLVPFLLFVIIFFIALFSLGGIEIVGAMVNQSYLNPFSLIVGISFFILLLIFLYLAYRMSFAYIIMLDSGIYDEKQKGLFYVKESIRISSGVKIFKFLLFVLIYSIILLPFDYIGKSVEDIEVYSFIYGIVVFLIFGGLFEMLIVSIYKNIMLDKKEDILAVKNGEEVI